MAVPHDGPCAVEVGVAPRTGVGDTPYPARFLACRRSVTALWRAAESRRDPAVCYRRSRMAFGVSTLWSKSRMSEEGCPQPAATATAPEALAAVMSAGLSPTKSMPVGGTPTSTAASITDAGYRAAGRGQARCRFGQSGPIHGGDGRHEDGYDRRYLINPRTNRNAASTCLISSLVRRPATSPSL